MKRYLVFILISLMMGSACKMALAQPSLETFGHNRVQNEKFRWHFYQTKHFKVYYYGRTGRTLARYVSEQAEEDINTIEHNVGGFFNKRIDIILYNNYDDFKETNIGLNSDMQMQNNNPAGTVHLVGNKLVAFFNGSHTNLRLQLRQGMAEMIMEHLLFGSNFRQMARNVVLLDLPEWITDGYVDFIVRGWTATDDNRWKNIITEKQTQYFNDLCQKYPRLAGMAFWQYLALKYGHNKVKNLLYLTQMKGSINKACKLVLHQKIYETFDSVLTFYQKRYVSQQHLFEPLDTANALIKIPIPDDRTHIRDIVVSPRGTDVAYVWWKDGEYKVILEKTHKINNQIKHERSVLLYGGTKDLIATEDPNYPMLAWNNTGFKLGILYKSGTYIELKVYNAIKATIWNYRIPRNRFDRVTGFTFTKNDGEIILSAVKNGQSDLYSLKFRGFRLKKITDDPWDDADPVLVSGGSRKGIIFLSNRPEPYINILPLPNELPTGHMNAFFYSTTTKSYHLLQLTHNKDAHISDIVPYGQDNFAYLSDKNGINNRYLVMFARDVHNMDSAFSVPVTNYGRSIKYQNYNAASAKIADAIRYKNAFYVYFKPIKIPKITSQDGMLKLPDVSFGKGSANFYSPTSSSTEKQQNHIFNTWTHHAAQINTNNIRINKGDAFQSAFPSEKNTAQNQNTTTLSEHPSSLDTVSSLSENGLKNAATKPPETSNTIISSTDAHRPLMKNGKHIRYVDSTYLKMRGHRYYLSFHPDFFSIRLDNNLIFNRYQSYSQNAGQYANPTLAGMLMGRLFDKMEDYRFTGGLRIPANFSGLDYFLQFENFRRRIDWGLMFYQENRKHSYKFLTGGSSQTILQLPGKTVTSILQGKMSYPLDEVKSVHLFLAVRQDRMILKAQDIYGLALPDVQEDWGMARLAYISDNTSRPAMNIWNGLRYKFYGETMYKLHSDNDVYQLSTDTSGFKKHSFIYTLGFDVRYYQKIYKNFIFAMRLSGAHSGGNQQIIYYLGGEANAINSKFSNAVQPTQKMDYAFQSLATPLRGYDENARNGNTFLLGNFELRLPILTTFLHRPIQSTILKNLQAVAFVDIGNAWEGLLPTSESLHRPYHFSWPSNTGTPVVNVQIPNNTASGPAVGYGLGLRTMLWGYFVRADAAMNIQNQFHWYLSFGTDF